MQKRGTILILLAGLCAIVYWPLLKYPYVQDDWGVLTYLLSGEDLSVLSTQFLPQSQLMYRPLPWLYFSPIVHLFGANAYVHHVVALIVHSCTSFLVFLTVRRLGQKEPVPTLTAFMYVAAVSVHLDPLMWLVGTYDLTAAFFYFLTIFLFLSGKNTLSVVTLFCGLLCKESVVPLPFLLVLVLLLVKRVTPVEGARLLWPHMLILGLYVAFRMIITGAIIPGGESPYAIEISFPLGWANLLTYIRWLAEAGMPLQGVPAFMGLVIVTVLLLLMISGIPPLVRRRSSAKPSSVGRDDLLWPAWIIVALLPVLFLADHAFRYYLIYSLVPAIILLLRIIARILRLFGANHRGERWGMVCYALIICGSSAMFLYSQDADRWRERQLEGTNRLIGKGSEVAQVQKFLQENREEFRDYSILILDGLDGSLFGDSLGPRLWLDNPKMKVIRSSWVTAGGDSLFVDNGTGSVFSIEGSTALELEAKMERGNWTGEIVRRRRNLP